MLADDLSFAVLSSEVSVVLTDKEHSNFLGIIQVGPNRWKVERLIFPLFLTMALFGPSATYKSQVIILYLVQGEMGPTKQEAADCRTDTILTLNKV